MSHRPQPGTLARTRLHTFLVTLRQPNGHTRRFCTLARTGTDAALRIVNRFPAGAGVAVSAVGV